MLAPETLHGTRIVASASTLDAITWPAGTIVMRVAPDDVFVLGGQSIGVSGEHVIAEAEAGFVGWWLDADQLAAITAMIEWPVPGERPALAQGLLAGVPVKLHLTRGPDGDRALLLTHAAYADDLRERLP